MARHIKNLDDLPEFSPTMLDRVERAMQLVRPEKENVVQCRRDVMDAIRMIATLPAYVPPRVVEKQLRDIAGKLKAARASIDELPLGWRSQLRADNFLNELARITERSEELATGVSLATTKRSGGGRGERTAALQKRIAAEQAFDLLCDWGGRPPTLTKDGEYLSLAGMLFRIATGRKSEGEMGRACGQVFKNLRKDTVLGRQ
jgi:hypothetical protein